MANQLTYKVKFPNDEFLKTHSLKESKKHEIADWLIKHPLDTIEVYRGKKLYSTFMIVKNRLVSIRA